MVASSLNSYPRTLKSLHSYPVFNLRIGKVELLLAYAGPGYITALPYFVLELLYDQTRHSRMPKFSLSEIIKTFMGEHLPVCLTVPFGIHKPANHLLELVWNTILPHIPTYPKERMISMNDYNLYSLLHGKSGSELVPYGVNYFYDLSTSLIHASFDSGTLRFPSMYYRDSTQSLFWNLLAFEQLVDTKREYYFQSYVLFMNRLIKTEMDVRILERDGGINLRIREFSEIVSIFDSLARKVNYDDITNFWHGDVLREVDEYCETGFRRVRAYLVSLFTNSRWDPASGIRLFILNVTQTFFAVASYRSGRS